MILPCTVTLPDAPWPRPIELTPVQLKVCNEVAFRRWYVSGNSENNHGLAGKSIDLDYRGTTSECAAAAALGVFWLMGVNTYKGDDLAGGYQVRSTDLIDGCLIIRKDDDPKALYVLVIILGRSTFMVFPPIKGEVARALGKWKSPNGREGCYMVEQQALLAQAAMKEGAER